MVLICLRQTSLLVHEKCGFGNPYHTTLENTISIQSFSNNVSLVKIDIVANSEPCEAYRSDMIFLQRKVYDPLCLNFIPVVLKLGTHVDLIKHDLRSLFPYTDIR